MIDTNCSQCVSELFHKFQAFHLLQEQEFNVNENIFRSFLVTVHMDAMEPITCNHSKNIIKKSEEFVVTIPSFNFPKKSSLDGRKIISFIVNLDKDAWILQLATKLLTCCGFICLAPDVDNSMHTKYMLGECGYSPSDLGILLFDKIIFSDIVYIVNNKDNIVGLENQISFARTMKKELWWFSEHIHTLQCLCLQ